MKKTDNYKSIFKKLKKEGRRNTTSAFLLRMQKYNMYYTVLSHYTDPKITEVFFLLENERTAYLAPITLWYLRSLDCPNFTMSSKQCNIDIPEAIVDVVNESILHALRILIDRTALFAHIIYPYFDKKEGFGSINGKNQSGFIRFIKEELENEEKGSHSINEKDLVFFKYVKRQYDDWIHNLLFADNKTKHNGSLRPLYDISKPILVTPDAYELRNKNQRRTRVYDDCDWEKQMNRVYRFFDKVFEHITTVL